MNPNFFNATKLAAGYSATLVTHLGDMILRAEHEYGPRDRSWTILGVEFGPDPNPFIWYPRNCKHIAIRLAPNALEDMSVACYQLAHECIHLLAPTGTPKTSVLEEGLATVFAEDYLLAIFNRSGFTNEVNYITAAALVRELLMEAPDSIARLRAKEPNFAKLSAKAFADAGLQTSQEKITKLLAPFNYG